MARIKIDNKWVQVPSEERLKKAFDASSIAKFAKFDVWLNAFVEGTPSAKAMAIARYKAWQALKPTCEDCSLGNCNDREKGHWCPEFTE